MRTNLDTGDIEAFASVGQTLSFKAAASLLNISPSALSRRIQKLEEQLDARLLDRTTRNVKLTLRGRQFLASSQELLARLDELLEATQGEGGPRASSVRIASIPSIVHRLVPGAIRLFNERYPATRLSIRDMTTNEVVDSVMRGDSDFGVTSFVQHDASLEFLPFIRGQFVAVTPPGHPLSGRKRVRWADLAGFRVISTWKGAGVRMAMDLDLAKASYHLAPFYEVQQIYTALQFVTAGLGVAPIPDFFLGAAERRNFGVIPLIDPVISADLGTVVSRNHPLRQHARDLYDLVRASVDAGRKARV